MTNKARIAIASAVLALPLALALPAMAQSDREAIPEQGSRIRLSLGERPMTGRIKAGERLEMTDEQKAEMEARRAACRNGEADGCPMGGFGKMGRGGHGEKNGPFGQGGRNLTEEQKKAIEPHLEKIRALREEMMTIIGE